LSSVTGVTTTGRLSLSSINPSRPNPLKIQFPIGIGIGIGIG
jgi:hypothetical protein